MKKVPLFIAGLGLLLVAAPLISSAQVVPGGGGTAISACVFTNPQNPAISQMQSCIQVLTQLLQNLIQQLAALKNTQAIPVALTSLSPTSGPVGTQVTISGFGLNTSGNTIYFAGYPQGTFNSISALTGSSLSFSIPSALAFPCADQTNPLLACPLAERVVVPGNYDIWVSNANGTSNHLTFTVTGSVLPPQPSGSVTISQPFPSSGLAGTQVTMTCTGCDSSGNTIYFAGYPQGTFPSPPSLIGSTLSFSIPSTLAYPCTGTICHAVAARLVLPGSYDIWATNSIGTSNHVSFTVTGGLSTGGNVTVTRNTAFSDQTVVKGSVGARIGSYVLTAPASEAVSVNTISVYLGAGAANFQNLKLMVSAAQYGTTWPRVLIAGNTTFSGNVVIPAGASTVVDVYADVLNLQSGSLGALTSFAACGGAGQVSASAYSCFGTPTGQNITIAGAGSSSGLSATVSNNGSFASRQVVMGNTNVSLAKILIQDTAGLEALGVRELKFTVSTVAGTSPAFQNLKLYDSLGNFIAGAGPVSLTVGSASTYIADFNLGTAQNLTVPMGGSAAFELRGDFAPFTLNSSSENKPFTISIAAPSDVVMFGRSSNSPVIISDNASGALSTLTPIRSKLNITGVTLGSDSACGNYTGGASFNRPRTPVDYVACIKLSADSSGQDVRLNALTLTFTGSAVKDSAPFSVSLIDPQTQSAYDGSAAVQALCATAGAGTCFAHTASFTFNGTPINQGQTKGVVVQINSANFASITGQATGLDSTINAPDDVSWSDGSSSMGASSGLWLSGDVPTPLLLSHVDYQGGGGTGTSLSVSPASLAFTVSSDAINNATPASSQLTLTNFPDIGTTVGLQQPGATWLSVGSVVGSGSVKTIKVTPMPWNAPGGLPSGTYTASIAISANGQTITVPVTLTVTPSTVCVNARCPAPPPGCVYTGGGACVFGMISCGTLICAPTMNSSVAVSTNGAVGQQNVPSNSVNEKIGSFLLTAPSAEGVRVNSINILTNGSAGFFQNLKVMVGSVQFGQTQATLANNSTYIFTGTPITVPVGGTAVVDVYADVLTWSQTILLGTQVIFSGCSGVGVSSFAPASCTGVPAYGQYVNIIH